MPGYPRCRPSASPRSPPKHWKPAVPVARRAMVRSPPSVLAAMHRPCWWSSLVRRRVKKLPLSRALQQRPRQRLSRLNPKPSWKHRRLRRPQNRHRKPPRRQSPQASAAGEILAERRHPLRFVLANGRRRPVHRRLRRVHGAHGTANYGGFRPNVEEIAAELKLDPQSEVARAVATRETWSGITVAWPVDDGGESLPVELSGLPVFDRERNFRGYRGFGVCRDISRINQLARARRERPIGLMPPPERANHRERHQETPPRDDRDDRLRLSVANRERSGRSRRNLTPTAANVVPFRPGRRPKRRRRA